MENNIAKANIYAKEKYGYSFVSLLMEKGNGNVKQVLDRLATEMEILAIYALVDSVFNGKGE